MEINQTQESPSLGLMLIPSGTCLVLGGILIYMLDIPWHLAPEGIVYSLTIGSGCAVIVYLLLMAYSRLQIAQSLKEIMQQLRPMFEKMGFWQILLLSLTAGIGEELFFRGFLQIWFFDFMSPEFAIIWAAVCFGLLHFASVSYFLISTVLGLALGFTYYYTGDLLLIMTWHTVYDLIAIWVISRHPRLVGME